MNTTSVLLFITKSGYLIGVAGMCVCLLLFYLQIFRVFIPGLGDWSPFRISRLFGLSQRFAWLLWLTGLSLLFSQISDSPAVFQRELWGDKLLLLIVLVLSMMGLDRMVKNMFLSIEGGSRLFRNLFQAIWFKFCLALSMAGWSGLLFFIYCYLQQQYSRGMLLVIALVTGTVVFSLLLILNNQWANYRVSRETVAMGR